MVNAFASLFIFLLCYYIAPVATDLHSWDRPLCTNSPEGTPCILKNKNDCLGALEMIPSGQLALDPAHPGDRYQPQPIDLAFHQGRQRKFFLPAAFRFGNCVISAEAVYSATQPRPPTKAASAMYFTVWPNVRKSAAHIIEQCSLIPFDRTAGWVTTKSRLGQWEFAYKVTVTGTPKNLRPADARGRRQLPPFQTWFNIYDGGGDARNSAGPLRGGGNGYRNRAAH
ncbi:hypothetical protein MMC30_006455 [Trapelia coarctata]|nr:hypothetical protein [Trapelia coarctata]